MDWQYSRGRAAAPRPDPVGKADSFSTPLATSARLRDGGQAAQLVGWSLARRCLLNGGEGNMHSILALRLVLEISFNRGLIDLGCGPSTVATLSQSVLYLHEIAPFHGSVWTEQSCHIGASVVKQKAMGRPMSLLALICMTLNAIAKEWARSYFCH